MRRALGYTVVDNRARNVTSYLYFHSQEESLRCIQIFILVLNFCRTFPGGCKHKCANITVGGALCLRPKSRSLHVATSLHKSNQWSIGESRRRPAIRSDFVLTERCLKAIPNSTGRLGPQ